MDEVTFGTRQSLGNRCWASHYRDNVFGSENARERLSHGERVEDHQSSRLETSKLPSTLLPAPSISQTAWGEVSNRVCETDSSYLGVPSYLQPAHGDSALLTPWG